MVDEELSIRNVILNEYDNHEQLCSAGIHPWYINETDLKEAFFRLEQLVETNSLIAVGECGLDKLINVPLEIQEKIFIEQLKIAEKYKKPVIIHCVKAFDDLIRIRKALNLSVPLIVHGFNNNWSIAQQLLKNEFYVSLGKALLNEKSNASKIINKIPLHHIFLETDNTEIPISLIFERAAILLNLEVEQLKKSIFINFKKIFNYHE